MQTLPGGSEMTDKAFLEELEKSFEVLRMLGATEDEITAAREYALKARYELYTMLIK